MHPSQLTPRVELDVWATGPTGYERKTRSWRGTELYVLQRSDVLESFEVSSRVASEGILPSGKIDVWGALQAVIRHTVKDNNFGLEAGKPIRDEEFGWFLVEWLQVYDIVQKWLDLQDGKTGSVSKKKFEKPSSGRKRTPGRSGK